MPDFATANLIAAAIDGLIVVFTVHACVALVRARRDGAAPFAIVATILAGLAVGSLNAFVPPFSVWRESVFVAQPAMILGMIAALTLASFAPAAQRYFATADLRPIFGLYAWRAVFGFALLFSGLAGGLPAAFFWSAAAGDILVGLWALSISARGVDRVGHGELLAWNGAGLIDLTHVLALGVANLAVFYAANPDASRLTLLPLFGVPLFIAIHFGLFRTILARRAAAAVAA